MVTEGQGDGRTQEILTAIRHPVRREILKRVIESDRITPTELAVAMQEPLSNVSYHVRHLHDHNMIALVDTEQRRGSLAHFYKGAENEPWLLHLLGIRHPPLT
ncbi:MAG: helix-turn-helix transcriptional regulator [Actinobacteria bacterium]|nr:helix-turn-helix transcriptional regulator [Actinomycetota bacterium]